MFTANRPQNALIRLPKMAAMILFFWGLTANNHHIDTAMTWPVRIATNAVPANNAPTTNAVAAPARGQPAPLFAKTNPPTATTANDLSDPSHVLSAKDAEFYSAAFDAQEKSDWASADAALGKVKDKRLIGHVLADRYQRRPITLDEAHQWMASYADLPEASSIYDKAKHQRGFAADHMGQPVMTAAWGGTNNFGSPLGFRNTNETDDSSAKAHVDARINAALHRGDPMEARELLSTELQRGTLTVSEAGDIISHIAATFFYEGQIERARPMAHLAASSNAPLGLWIDGLSAWKQHDFAASAQSFAILAQIQALSPWDRAAAAYWAYRAAKHTGNEQESRHWLAEAAKYPRSFYGYMAASLTDHHTSRSWKLPELTARHINTLAQRPAGWQALALLQLGKNDLAESELRRLNPMGHRDVQNATLALAEKSRMPSLTLQLGGMATNDNGQPYEAALYPVPPWQPSHGFKIDRALLFAVMKRESKFDPDAVSQSGACGLMQIMPSTAHQIANENTIGGECSDRLFDPATNMELGQKYVRVLAGQPMIGDNLLLLLAAYNGGPGNVAHWLDGEAHNDPLLFLESLPVRETRDYVQQVLMHYWMYRSRLAEPETSVAQLARGEWPRYALRDNGVAGQQQAQSSQIVEVAQR
jgi:soluble lytic murein transglycosylase-like protein